MFELPKGGIEVTAPHAHAEVERMNARLAEYVKASRRSLAYILRKKGNDIRIKLFQEFNRVKERKDFAGGEFAKRTRKRAAGILVREMELDPKFLGIANETAPTKSSSGKPLSLWQQLVFQEIARRDYGVGVLGKSFLASKGVNRFLGAKSNLGDDAPEVHYQRKALKVDSTADEFRIEGFTPGEEKVSLAHGILGKAMARASADIEKYFGIEAPKDAAAAGFH